MYYPVNEDRSTVHLASGERLERFIYNGVYIQF